MRYRFFASLIVFAALAWLPATASLALDFSCSVTDTSSDPTLSPGQGFDGAPYQDILRTAIDRNGGSVVFSMEVAAAIPAAPLLKTPHSELLWMWGMNTTPGVAQGFPLAPGVAGLLEFWIHVGWDGAAFQAVVIDRRPALHGGVPLVTPVSFEIIGAIVKVTAPSSLFDDPSQFRWGSSTWIWPTHLGTTSAKVVDRAPNGPASICP